MDKKSLSSLFIGVLIGLVVGLAVVALRPQVPSEVRLSGQTEDSFATTQNLSASGTLNIAGASTLTGEVWFGSSSTITGLVTLGSVSGTASSITGIRCVNQNYDVPSLLAFQTSSVATALSLVGPSSTVALFATLNTATSSVPYLLPIVISSGTATSAVAQVTFTNVNASSTSAINAISGVLTTCAIQQ